MQSVITIPRHPETQVEKVKDPKMIFIDTTRPGALEKTIIWWAIKLRIFYFACIVLKKPKLIWRTFQQMLRLRTDVWGGDLKKIYRVEGKYYFNQYTPGWPSKAYDTLIKGELRRHAKPLTNPEKLSFVFLAITRKCPMRCEHCFEWDNLNQREVFTEELLTRTIEIFQEQGVLQMHFSGGEPMVRFRELVRLVSHASKKSECWVLTSGFNFTSENAVALKNAGCRGVVVSIDHHIPELHNMFRGNAHAFEGAVKAAREVRRAGMVLSISVCATEAFIEGQHLLPFLDLARDLGAHFVQLLEPKNVGHYREQEVLLEKHHIDALESIFRMVNHDTRYRDYPTLLYHGYHQRRVGCFSGSRSVYVDSIGDVHACPFCHTKSYNIIEVLKRGYDKLPVKENSCPRYESIA